MGQQQLLLLVLGIVIVGLAVAGGIQTFGEKRVQSKIDTMREVALGVAGEVIAWKQTPAALGGGDQAAFLTGLTLPGLGYGTPPGRQIHVGAGYLLTFSGADANGMHVNVLDYHGAGDVTSVRGADVGDIGVQVRIFGPSLECIQFTPQWRNGLLGTEGWAEDGEVWLKEEAPWNLTGDIPAACPTTW
jgi:hypothetical protein